MDRSAMKPQNGTVDVTGNTRQPGVGLATLFLCPLCAKRKQSLGRRLRRVDGVRQWVCKPCVAKED